MLLALILKLNSSNYVLIFIALELIFAYMFKSPSKGPFKSIKFKRQTSLLLISLKLGKLDGETALQAS